MVKRLALLIGNTTFDDTRTFSNLRTPVNDVWDFAHLLQEYGNFEITSVLVDATAENIKRAIDDLFSEAERGDLTLLYYSGHGYRGRDNRYYLVAKDTQANRLLSTGVTESFIHDAMSSSRSRHRVIILDCCFSGAFIKGRRKGGAESLLLEELKGEATAILASSGIVQYSFEEDGRNSLFTQYMLFGIETGQADEDEDGQISIDELFHYADRMVRDTRPEQTPMLELSVRESKIFIAANLKSHATLSKLRKLENFTSQALEEFHKSKLEIPYPERMADEYIRKKLVDLPNFQPGFWIIIGEAGIGKSTLLLQLVEWCLRDDRYFPIWLDQDLLYKNGEKLSQLFDCQPNDWGLRLQNFVKLVRKPLVLFIDGLDVILPHTDDDALVSQLNELASNAVLICSSRLSEYKLLKESGIPRVEEEIILDELSDAQVRNILRQASSKYKIQLDDLHPKLIQMCQNPFILYLLLESSKTESLPSIANPTDTRVKELYWYKRIEQVRPQAFLDYRFDRMSKDEVGQAKAKIVYKVADRMLKIQTYRLTMEVLDEVLEEIDLKEISMEEILDQRLMKQTIYQELVAENVIRGRNYISFFHDSFAEFVICKQILTSYNWQSTIDWLFDQIFSPFYLPIVVHLVMQARDIGKSEVESRIYNIMVKILEKKRENQLMMNRSWGVTYALHQLAFIWAEKLCGSLIEHCPQEAASSIASVLQDVRHPQVVPTLIDGMSHYKYKKRFIDGLGASADPATVEPLLNLLEKLLRTREDDELLETISVALGNIRDERAQQLLAELEADGTIPLKARRAAREALWLITNLAKYSESIPYTDEEYMEGLRTLDKNDPTRYSDWKMVKQTATRIALEAKKGKSISPAVTEALVKALDHEHEDAQRAVIKPLTISGSEVAVHGLISKVLDTQTPDATRKEIVESLVLIATRSTTNLSTREYICTILTQVAQEDSNPQVKQAANDAINDLCKTQGLQY